MAYESFPNQEHNNRAVSLAENEQLLTPLGLTGLVGYNGQKPVYADGTGTRTVKIRAGVAATIRGTRFNNLTETLVASDQIVANSSGQPRIDLLVLRLNRAATAPKQFTISPVVITGTPAASPLAPTPVRNSTMDGSGVWDLPLCEIAVPNGAGSFADTALTNKAWWVTGSGYVGFDTARPPVEAGVIFQAAGDSGISYIGTSAGSWVRIYSDTGAVNIGPVPSGWDADPFTATRQGDLVVMNARLVRTGGTIANTSSVTMGRVGVGYRPKDAVYGVYHCSYPDHSSHVTVNTDGYVTFVGTSNGDPIGQGSSVYANLTWPADN